MKKKLLYFTLLAFSIFILICGCNKKEINSPNSMSIEYLSFQGNGCTSSNVLSKTNDEAVLNWQYVNGVLQIGVLFSAQCVASMKDSVLVSNNIIDIYLSDTSSVRAKCNCPYKVIFNFRVEGNNEIKISFYYKPQSEYYLLADTTLILIDLHVR